MILKSLRLKITLWAGICLLTTALIIQTYSALTMKRRASITRNEVIQAAQDYTVVLAKQHANSIKAELEVALYTARTLAQTLSGIKDEHTGVELGREEVIGILRIALIQNSRLSSIYTAWEPNAFDWMDRGYILDHGHDATGRFVPSWSWGINGDAVLHPLVNYDDKTAGKFYFLPKKMKTECVIEPFQKTIENRKMRLTSLVAPIMVNETFYGIVGVDISLDNLQVLVDDLDMRYQEATRILLISHTGILACATGRADLIGQPLSALREKDYDETLQKIQAGEEVVEVTGDSLEVFTPVTIGRTTTPWSVNVVIPMETVTAAADVQMRQAVGDMWKMIGINMGCAALLLSVLWFIARTMTNPLHELKSAVDRFRNKDFTVQVPIVTNDEIGSLADAFNSMARQLKQYAGQLETMVDEKTKDLQKTNTALATTVQDLEQTREQLEEQSVELQETNRQLRQSKEAADTASRAKSDFLANMSHEIRTPMNAIIGLTDLLFKSTLTSKQTRYLKKIRESSDHLLEIINDLLDFSKIEEGRLEIDYRDFMLNHVIGKVADIISERAARKEIELFYLVDKAVPLCLKGDPLRLNQILINLMGNSVKFTENGHIILKIGIDASNAPDHDRVTLLFSVEDTGIGISQDQIEPLFQAFTQADGSVTRKYGGTGLGLSICRQLTTAMGGRIWAKSAPGKGCTFFFSLPFDIQPESNPYPLRAPRDLRELKVLVADDNEVARIIFKEILSGFDNFRITVTGSGSEALDTLKNALPEDPFDLLIVDWRMPVMDGFEVIRKIRNDPLLGKEAYSPKIIMVTLYGREDLFQRIKAGDTGVDGFIFKPVSSSSMFNGIMEAFGKDEALVPSQEREIQKIDFNALGRIKGAEILLVEDNVINQEVTLALLERVGFKIRIVENGIEAVEILKKRQNENLPMFDAVLMDIEMPEMDGYEATKRIRSLPKLGDVPIIAMTAHALKGDREKCLAAGMNDYLTKPVVEHRLYALLCQWIQPKRPAMAALPVEAIREATLPEGYPPVLPGIDLAASMARLGCSEKKFKMMLQGFREKYCHAADALQTHLDRGEMKDAQRLVHNVKGTSGNLCAEALFATSQMLDSALKLEEMERVPTLIQTFKERLDTVIQSLEHLDTIDNETPVEKKGTSPETEADADQVESVLREMYGLLKKKRSQGWKLLETLLNMLPDRKYHEEKIILEKSMAQLNTKKALDTLESIANTLQIPFKGEDV